MATTTNYGWTTPDDTALVKDGASAIRSLGSAIDSTTKNLNPQTTTGAIAYRSSTSNVNTALPIGTAGQLLRVNSGATAPEWFTAPASGGMTLIATSTPSGATTVSFTSIATSYKELLLVWDSVFQSVTDQYFSIRLNNDSTGNYHSVGTNLVAGSVGGFSQSAATSFGNSTTIAPIPATATSAGTLNRTANGFMHIYNADQTTGAKRIVYSSYGYSASAFNDFQGAILANGIYAGTSAISQIDFIRSSTQTITGTIRLYGVS